MPISIVIPVYKSPDALNLALKSCIEGQYYKNEIICIIDGFYDINKEVLEKYKDYISILNLEQNVGMIRAMNIGHFNASNDLVLHAQEDHVFPYSFDKHLVEDYVPGCVLTPNQIEPFPSMFSQFYINDLGRNPKEFDLQYFWLQEQHYISEDVVEETGSTFPFLINKYDYLKIGGFDESYPGPWVVDWEFFMKCQMNGMKMLRTYKCHFYHFVSLSTKSPEQLEQAQKIEQECHDYFKYKWGSYAKHNPLNNLKTF